MKKERDNLIYVSSLLSASLLALHLYFYSYHIFRITGIYSYYIDIWIARLYQAGLLSYPFLFKVVIIFLLIPVLLKVGKSRDISIAKITVITIISLGLFFFPRLNAFQYFITTLLGYIGVSLSFAIISSILQKGDYSYLDEYDTFEQCRQLIENPDSVNIKYKYKYQGRYETGYINVVNPFRATYLLGTIGAGKTFSIINQFIDQMIEKGYTMACYDFKYPSLTERVYNDLLLNYKKYKVRPKMYILNFNDPEHSHRCNPMHPLSMTDPADSVEISEIVMENVNKSKRNDDDFFSISAKLFLDCIIWFLKIYKNGKYCTFPHAIELMGQNYLDVFKIMSDFEDLDIKIMPFMDAIRDNAPEQLQGQLATARVSLNKFISPALYWVLSGDDLALDINNPDEPKIICIGNDPNRKGIYGAALAVFFTRLFRVINKPGKLRSAVILDELPTMYTKELDQTIGVARSNKVAFLIGAQDESQLIRDYKKDEANVILNSVANRICGNVSGDTAEHLSKLLGKVYKRQISENIGDSSSESLSYHLVDRVPPWRLSSLSQGEFVGVVADDRSAVIKEKFFAGSVQVDMKKEEWLNKNWKKIPPVSIFEGDVDQAIKDNFKKIRNDVRNIIKEELERISLKENSEMENF